MKPKTTTPPRRGRPPVASPRTIVWPTRFTEEEAKAIDQKAREAGKPRGKWIREQLLAA